MRPFLYALHDYGMFIFGTSGGTGRTFAPGEGPKLEGAFAWVQNGYTNPWISWFQSNGATTFNGSGGNPLWHFTVNNFWTAIASNLQVVSSCYSRGTCSDSINPDPVDAQVLQATGTSTTATSNSLTTIGTAVGFVLVGSLYSDSIVTFGAPSGGFTALGVVPPKGRVGSFTPIYRIVTTGGTFRTSASLSSSASWYVDLLAIKTVLSGGGGGADGGAHSIRLKRFPMEHLMVIGVCWIWRVADFWKGRIRNRKD